MRTAPYSLTLESAANLFQVRWSFDEDPADLPRWFRLEYASEGRFSFIPYSPHIPNTMRVADVSAVLSGYRYAFRVRAEWEVGTPLESDWSNIVEGQPFGDPQPGTPVVPTDMTGEGISSNHIRFRWTKSAGATKYTIAVELYDLEGPIPGTQQYLGVGDVSSAVFPALTPSTSYYCRIAAGNDLGYSDFSPPSYADTLGPGFELPAPLDLLVIPQSTTAAWATWSGHASAVQFRLERKLQSNPSWVGATSTVYVPPNEITTHGVELTGLTPGAAYDLRVRAEIDVSTFSEWSTTQFTMPAGGGSPPDAPVNLVANVTLNLVTLSCDVVSGAVGYLWTVGGSVFGTDGAELVLSLPWGSTTEITVQAVDSDGNVSDPSDSIEVTIPTLTPDAPTIDTVAGDYGQVALTWTNGVDNADWHEIEATRTYGSTTDAPIYVIAPGTLEEATLLNQPYSATYAIRMRHVRQGEPSEWSNTVTTTTPGPKDPIRELVLQNVVATLQGIQGTYPYRTKLLDVRRCYEPGTEAKVRPCAYVLEPSENAPTLNPGAAVSDHVTSVDMDLPIQVWLNGTGQDRAQLISNVLADVQAAMAADVRRGGHANATYYQSALAFDQSDKQGTVLVVIMFVIQYRFAAKDPTRRV